MVAEFIMSVWRNPLLWTALMGGLLASIVSGVVGSYVVVKRISFISGSIAHAVLGGMGLCLWLNRVMGWSQVTPLHGAIGSSVVAALLIGWISLRNKSREDAAIAALWTVGMAIGMLFISQTPGYNVELSNFLVGNILWVTPDDLWLLAGLDAVALISVFLLHKRLLVLCFDEDQARLQGVKVERLYLFLLVLVALSVVMLTQVVGIVLVITMLTIPAAIANLFVARLSRMMVLAVCFSALFFLSGTVIAFYLDWPAGSTVALTAGISYIATLGVRRC